MKNNGTKDDYKLSGSKKQMDTGMVLERGNSGREPCLAGQIMRLTWKWVGNNFSYRSGARGWT